MLSPFASHAPAAPASHTLSLHDALPICFRPPTAIPFRSRAAPTATCGSPSRARRGSAASRRPASSPSLRCRAPTRAALRGDRSEEHTSELQSLRHLVCRLLLEKKKQLQQ